MKLNNKTYDWLKWTCMIFLPALATLISVLDKAWGWGLPVEAIVTTISAIAAFIGAVLGFSSALYNDDKPLLELNDEGNAELVAKILNADAQGDKYTD